jgi:hypothetical protein
MPARLGHHRRRSGAARSWRHHKLFGSGKEAKGNSTKIVLVALDLLYLNGYDLAHGPEKCAAVFPKRSCANNKLKRDGDST